MAEKATPPKAKGASPAPGGERIAKVLSRAGIASRREAERLIELGEVTVNGRVIDSPALNVTAADKVTVRGEPVGAPDVARLWLYYKPEGLVTSTADEKGRDTVFDHLPEDLPRVMSIGRLDLNSEGLLLLTNDGELKRRLELPSTGWLRKYRVRIKGNPTEPDLEPLRRGITVEGERFLPMEVKLDRIQGANAWLTVGLREGRNREIRRAMTAIGVTVNRLIRISYGPFRLNEMEPGDVEEIKGRVLRDQLGLAGVEEEAPAARPRRTPAAPRGDKPEPGKTAVKPVLRPAKPTVRSRNDAGGAAAKPAAKLGAKTPARRSSGPLATLSRTWADATTPQQDPAKPARRVATGTKPAPAKRTGATPDRADQRAAGKAGTGKAATKPAATAAKSERPPAAKPAAKATPATRQRTVAGTGAKPAPRSGPASTRPRPSAPRGPRKP